MELGYLCACNTVVSFFLITHLRAGLGPQPSGKGSRPWER